MVAAAGSWEIELADPIKFNGFIGGSHNSRSSFFDSQRCVNLFPQISKSGTSKNVAALFGVPGKEIEQFFYQLPLSGGPINGGIRGSLRVNQSLALVAAGPYLWKYSAIAEVPSVVGNLDAYSTPVVMAYNGIDVMIVTGPSAYVYTVATGAFVKITSLAFKGADTVGFVNGYFVWNQPGTGRYQISDLYSTTINPLNYATAEGSPDLLLSLLVDHSEIWLFGENSTEVHYNNGNTLTFPFSRIDGAFIEQGIAAAFSAAKMGDTVYWLASNAEGQGTVQRAVGYRSQRISDHDIEYEIAKYAKESRIDDARAYTYQQEGHSFYVLTFPSADKTWVYDATTEEWHERASYNQTTGKLGRDRAQNAISFRNKILVGDWELGVLYDLSLDIYSDGGQPLSAIRQCPYISDGDKWIFFEKLWVDIEVGVGLGEDNPFGWGYDPGIYLSWSDDGGGTWKGNRRASIGKVGERKIRCNFRRLGKSKQRIFRLTIDEPVKRVLIDARLELTTSK